ncbi:unnamed protein product [Caretta caretta]
MVEYQEGRLGTDGTPQGSKIAIGAAIGVPKHPASDAPNALPEQREGDLEQDSQRGAVRDYTKETSSSNGQDVCREA